MRVKRDIFMIICQSHVDYLITSRLENVATFHDIHMTRCGLSRIYCYFFLFFPSLIIIITHKPTYVSPDCEHQCGCPLRVHVFTCAWLTALINNHPTRLRALP